MTLIRKEIIKLLIIIIITITFSQKVQNINDNNILGHKPLVSILELSPIRFLPIIIYMHPRK